MEGIWQLQEAKNKFSEVVDRALKIGPQEITRHGKKTVVLISVSDFEKLKRKKRNLVDFFQNSPLGEMNLKRSRELPRDVSL